MINGISIREFARRAGCNEKVVRRKLQTHHLPRLADGKIDPAFLTVEWRKGERPVADSAGIFVDSADTYAAPVLLFADGYELWSRLEAERVEENFAARLKQLEYEREVIKYVEVSEAARILAEECAIVRGGLQGIAPRVAERVARTSSAAEIMEIINAEVCAALTVLTAAALADISAAADPQ